MMTFQHLSVEQLKVMFDEREVILLDTRDEASYQAGHIDGALRLDERSVTGFVNETAKDSTVVVVCYHGHSSQSAANYLAGQGFSDVYSLDGGYTAWASSSHR
ncbi:MAG: thiosulfate sulfurtransferase GlpE [Gammaproteobacteria bacterium]|nr:thiosulfate sulfurtransferase GlpE [Gammaproteobacteria bacterium]MBQ0841039.1 thiosulfate sulfurtransferase GlpE [Gammaproteobacteria bacterium]